MPLATIGQGGEASTLIISVLLTLTSRSHRDYLQSMIDVEFPAPLQLEQLARRARERNWGLSLLLVGWLHLLAFGSCWFLTASVGYHDAPGYLAIWLGELFGMAVIFRLCGGTSSGPSPALERLVVRVWISYFLLAFNLGTLNTLRGHAMFEFFPAMASLASYAFLVMTFVVDRRFFAAVLVMFTAGLLMAAYLLHAYLIFAMAWWLVLEGIGLQLWRDRRASKTSLAGALPVALAPASMEHEFTTRQTAANSRDRQPHHRTA
jgi:hypothetical protein